MVKQLGTLITRFLNRLIENIKVGLDCKNIELILYNPFPFQKLLFQAQLLLCAIHSLHP